MNKGLIFNGFAEYNITAERPAGAHRIAHYLRQLDWDVEVIDYVLHWDFESIKELLKSRLPLKFIGVNVTWILYDPKLKELCDYIKDTYPDIILVIGGQVSTNPDIPADYFVEGFGELAIKAILDYEFSNGKKPTGRPFASGWHIDAIHFYPSYPFDSYMIDYEDRDFLTSTDVVTVELSRGCRFQCKYCNFPILGVKEDNSVSEKVIYDFLKQTNEQWGITNFLIADETANDRSSKLEKLANAVQRSNFNPNFSAFVRADLIRAHPEQTDLMIGARLWGHFYGVETFNHRSGKVVGKGLDPNIVKEIVLDIKTQFTQRLGLYRGTMSMIAGLPYETVDDLENTFNWFVNNWSDQNWIMFLLTIPKPGSNLKASEITLDYSKYGYSEMTQQEVDVEVNRLKDNGEFNVMPLGLSDFFWRNENGTYFDFLTACLKYDGYASRQGRVSNFEILAKQSLGCSLDMALAEQQSNRYTGFDLKLKEIVQTYIDKKLSL